MCSLHGQFCELPRFSVAPIMEADEPWGQDTMLEIEHLEFYAGASMACAVHQCRKILRSSCASSTDPDIHIVG